MMNATIIENRQIKQLSDKAFDFVGEDFLSSNFRELLKGNLSDADFWDWRTIRQVYFLPQ